VKVRDWHGNLERPLAGEDFEYELPEAVWNRLLWERSEEVI
jgi:hypothetical protein